MRPATKRRRLTSTSRGSNYSISMSTRSKQPAPDGTVTDSSDRAAWTQADESTLIWFLIEHKAEAGDGMNFKAQTWKAAAAELLKSTSKGAPKTAASCKSKWQRVCIIFFSCRISNCFSYVDPRDIHNSSHPCKSIGVQLEFRAGGRYRASISERMARLCHRKYFVLI